MRSSASLERMFNVLYTNRLIAHCTAVSREFFGRRLSQNLESGACSSYLLDLGLPASLSSTAARWFLFLKCTPKSFTTLSGTAVYSLPVQSLHLILGSHWNFRPSGAGSPTGKGPLPSSPVSIFTAYNRMSGPKSACGWASFNCASSTSSQGGGEGWYGC